MFEKASRVKLRFPFARGSISVEDLWDLTLSELDSIFKILNRQVKSANEESLLGSKSKEDSEVILKIDILKHVVSVLQTEAEIASSIKERARKKQELLALLNRKEQQAQENLSAEEIQAMIAELG